MNALFDSLLGAQVRLHRESRPVWQGEWWQTGKLRTRTVAESFLVETTTVRANWE